MGDDPKKRGAADRRKVAAGQDHEVRHVARKTGRTANAVKAAVKRVGNDRRAVEKALRER
mgnify:CR=1 FL=1